MKKDLVGKRYGRLVVLKEAKPHISKSGKTTMRMWLCRCDCGVEKEILGTSLLKGATKSCGCLNSEVARKMPQNFPENTDLRQMVKQKDYIWCGRI